MASVPVFDFVAREKMGLRGKKHVNIPIFIPHLGCPNNCVFCNQRSISGHMDFDEEMVDYEIKSALSTICEGTETEIAFFGGSFTGIDRGLMLRLLETAYKYVKLGRVKSIRLSTRPDYIDLEILNILKRYGVKTIELGLQSMVDDVLVAAKRGHTADCARNACVLIKEYGFELVGQMMIGLPTSTIDDEIYTASEICRMGADGARIYPTVVFYETELCELARCGKYTPLSTEEAVLRTKEALRVFSDSNVPCIRVGLCASENLTSEDAVFGGPNHSAIGELAMGELFYEKIDGELGRIFAFYDDFSEQEKNITVYVPYGAVSKAVGQKKSNIYRIKEKYFKKNNIKSIRVLETDTLIGYNIKIEISKTKK